MRLRRHHAGRRRSTTLRSGIIVLAIGGLLLSWAFVHRLPFVPRSAPATISAEFATAPNVDQRTPVRINGVTVGEVKAVRPVNHGRNSLVVMALGKRAHTVHTDATAQIRMRTFVSGGMYIDLKPGSRRAPLLGDRPIGMNATGTQVDWDQFNTIAQAPVRQGERRVFKGLREGFAAPADVRQTLEEIGPALESAGTATDALRGRERGEMTKLIRTTGRTLRALSLDGHSLGDFVDGAQRTFAATSDQHEALADTLAATPAALRASTSAMRRLDRTLVRLQPLAVRLRPGARGLAPTMRALRPALVEVNRLLDRLGPLLDAAPPALRALADASDQGSPLLRASRPIIDRLNGELLPWLAKVDPHSRLAVYQAIGPWLAALDSAQSGYDANGYFLRVDTKMTANSVIAPCDVGIAQENTQNCLTMMQALNQVRSQGRTP